MRFFGPYYYGKHKWDNYLLDIQDAIGSGNEAQRMGLRLQDQAGETDREQTEELRRQTEQLRQIEGTLRSGFEELRAEFQWGFTLMVDRMDRQIEALVQVAAKLDGIHKTIQSPLLTQARELFQLGQERYRRGLLDKALEAYLQAEQKNEVDFPLQLQIGKLFLYGRDEDDDVINLPEAEKHLLLAARYSNAEKGTLPQWNQYCGQAYFHAAIAAYLIGEQEHNAGATGSMRACLERAVAYLAKAASLWPAFTEIPYTKAKCHALLGQAEDTVKELQILSDRDRRYFAKAGQDEDFKALRDEVAEVFKRATTSPGPIARATLARLDEVAEALTWANRSAPTSMEDLAAIRSIEDEAAKARRRLATLDVDIEDLGERVSEMRSCLDEITQGALDANVTASHWSVASAERRKKESEDAIGRLKLEIKATSGLNWGIGMTICFPVATYFILFVLVNSLPVVRSAISDDTALLACMIAGGVGFAVGTSVSYRKQILVHKGKIEENVRIVDECGRSLPALRQQAEASKEQARLFAVWRTERPPAPRRTTGSTTSGSQGTPEELAVVLTAAGPNVINVTEVVQEVTGYDLLRANSIVLNYLPRAIKRGVDRAAAEAISRRLTDLGASVRIE